MKIISHDELGYPIGYSTNGFYSDEEKFSLLSSHYHNTKHGKYMVSTWGRLLNTETNNIVPINLIPEGENRYIRVQLCDINNNYFTVAMHRLVGEVYIFGKPVGPNNIIVINHIDGIKWHNEVYNLEWTTQSENVRHADRNNLIARPYGEHNSASLLTDEIYNEICRLTQEGYLPHQVNSIMNIGYDITNIVQKIRNGKSETLISQNYDFSNIPRNDYRKFDEPTVNFICQCLQDYPGIDYDIILQKLGYDTKNMDPRYRKKLKNTISTIKRRVSYIEIGKHYNF
jgi:hypothetical protein